MQKFALFLALFPSLALADTERMTFQKTVELALAHNPSVEVAEREIAHADALLWQLRAPSLPTLNGNVLYQLLDNDRKLNGVIVSAQNQVQLNAQLAMAFSPAKWAQWSHAKDNIDVAKKSAAETRRQVALASARTYLTIFAQHRQVELSERSLQTARAHADFARQRFNGGVGTRLDVVRADQEVATSDSQLATARVGLIRAQEALGQLIGSEYAVDVDDEPDLSLPGARPDIENRSDVRAARARTDAQRHTVRDDWTDFMPFAAATFLPFYQDPPTLTIPRLGWQFNVAVTWQIFDGGLRYGQHRERRVLFDEANTNQKATERQARSDVRTADQALRGAEDAAKGARAAATSSHEALDLANVAYRAGASTNLEVIDAERRARDADTAAVVAEDSARQAKLDLLTSLGVFP